MIRSSTGIGLLAAAVIVACLAVPGGAAQPGPLSYRGGGQGPVLFDHQLHARLGFVCGDCHLSLAGSGRQLFQTAKRSHIDMAAHSQDASCFACHNGAKASGDCQSCHR